MQKKLIVLAIASLASASAFAADTTFYGVVDAAVANIQGSGIIGGTTAVSGGLASSRFGVKSTEDLDNGLKVIAVLEYQIDPETNNTIGSATTTTTTATGGLTAATTNAFYARKQVLALAGDFGTVATGYLQTAGWDFGSKYNNLAGSAVSPLGNLTKAQGFLIGDQAALKRAQRAVAYVSPSIGGLTVAVNYASALDNLFNDIPQTNAAGGNTGATASLISVDYTEGPLAVGGVYASKNADDSVSSVVEYALGASYDLGVAKVLATYQSSSKPNATTATTATANATSANTVYSIGVTVPVAASDAVALSYAGSTINSIASAAASQNATSYGVAYLHPLSKTVTAYAAYSAVTQSNGTQGVTIDNALIGTTAGGTSSIAAVGLNKKF